MSKGHKARTQECAFSPDFPKEKIEERAKTGFKVEDISYGANLWVVVFTDSTNYSEQEPWASDEFAKNKLQSKLDKGWFITSLTFGNGIWGAMLSKGTKLGYTHQLILEDTKFPEEQVREKLLEGYRIMDITVGKGSYVVLMNQGTNIVSQDFFVSPEMPEEFIQQKSSSQNSSMITHMSYQDNQWYVVMSFGSNIRSQWYKVLNQYPRNTMTEGWSSGMIVTQFQKFRYRHEHVNDETNKPYLGRMGCYEAVSNKVCKELYVQMQNKGNDGQFDFEKLDLLSKWVQKNACFSTEQLTELIKLIQYEDTRFQFLEIVYPHTFDLDNFVKLKDALATKPYFKKFDKMVAKGPGY
ncbi:MAG: DUF4476 domain-containing protein [Bacteroidia bacterium]